MNISRLIITALVFAFMAGPAFAGKVTICHKGKTIKVDENAVEAHQNNHGDTIGKCPKIIAVAMMRCNNNGGAIEVSGVSASDESATILPIAETPCAVAVMDAMNEGYVLEEIHTGLEDGETEYLFIQK